MKLRDIFLSLVFTLFTFNLSAQNALSFDGSNDGVNCGTDTAFDISGNSLTIEAWIYATSWSSNIFDGSIVIKEDNSNNTGFMLRAGNGGRLGLGIGNGSKTWTEINTGSSVLSLNTWHHIAATYDGSFMRLYVDGSIVDSSSANISIAVNSSIALTIGYHPTLGRFWEGKIDEVRVWNTVRTIAELDGNKDDEFCSYQTGLKAYYKFDQGNAGSNNSGINTALDFSGHSNTASVQNFALTGSTSNWVQGASLGQSSTTVFDTLSNCVPFYDPNTDTYYSTSGTYYDTTLSYIGCDSVIIRSVIILGNTGSALSAQVCDSFISPNGSVYKNTGTYYNVYDNSKGCDSIITINLKVGADTGYIEEAVCFSFVSPSGKTLNQTGYFKDTVLSYWNCDSVISINLTVFGSSSSNLNLDVCDSVLSPSGRHWYRTEGTFVDTLISSRSCDSLVSVSVSSLKQFESLSPSECVSYTSPSSKTFTNSGQYMDTVTIPQCYKVYTIDLTILEPTSVNVPLSGCKVVVSPIDGHLFDSTGIYSYTLVNNAGCDSFVSLDVTVQTVNTALLVENRELTSLNASGAYQWLDCGNALIEVAGATEQSFKAENSGSYAVEIEENFCIDTSECFAIIGMGISDYSNTPMFKVYPNPTAGKFTIETELQTGWINAEVFNLFGQRLDSEEFIGANTLEFDLDLEPGQYYIKLTWEGGDALYPVIIN